MDCFEWDGLHNETLLRSCEEFDSLSENRLAHIPKHLQFAQINKKFQSDVNKKLSVQRSELIVSKKNISFKNWAKAIQLCNI